MVLCYVMIATTDRDNINGADEGLLKKPNKTLSRDVKATYKKECRLCMC